MKNTLFAGDLHLSADRPDITLAFLHFLSHGLENTEALYIIGDLFEVWMGDDIAEPFTIEISQALKTASEKLPIFFIHGNRDFMVGKAFCKRSGMTILPEVHCVDLYGVRTAILHGDSLCTLDIAYQRFRRFRSFALVRWIYSHLPKKTRLNIAANIRSNSQKTNKQKSYTIMDVEQSAVDQLLAETNTVNMIHGHTHRPAIHQINPSQQRIVVGDWYEQGSVLVVNEQGAELQSLPFQTKL